MPEFDKPRDVALRLNVSERTLANWRWLGTGPKFVKFGNGRSAPIRYRRSDVDQWVNENAGQAA